MAWIESPTLWDCCVRLAADQRLACDVRMPQAVVMIGTNRSLVRSGALDPFGLVILQLMVSLAVILLIMLSGLFPHNIPPVRNLRIVPRMCF